MIAKMVIAFLVSIAGIVGFFFPWSVVRGSSNKELYAYNNDFYSSADGLMPIFNSWFNFNYLFFLVVFWLAISFGKSMFVENVPKKLINLNTALSTICAILFLTMGFKFETGSFMTFAACAFISFYFIFELFISKVFKN